MRPINQRPDVVNDIDLFMQALFLKAPWVTRNHLKEEFGKLVEKSETEIDKSYDPIYVEQTLQPNSQPLTVNYNNRRHIFLWPTANFTASMEDLGTFAFVAGNWYNISFRDGVRIVNTSANAVNVLVKCTNEVVP